jgi:hypothetical protein
MIQVVSQNRNAGEVFLWAPWRIAKDRRECQKSPKGKSQKPLSIARHGNPIASASSVPLRFKGFAVVLLGSDSEGDILRA